jgi:hypothetical protein
MLSNIRISFNFNLVHARGYFVGINNILVLIIINIISNNIMELNEQLILIGDITKKLRKRLIEYRFARINDGISTHVNAIEMVLCLLEFAFDSPPREIRQDEENWFKGSYYVDMVFPSSSEWHDLSDMYSKLVDEVKKVGYFREMDPKL